MKARATDAQRLAYLAYLVQAGYITDFFRTVEVDDVPMEIRVPQWSQKVPCRVGPEGLKS